MDAAQALADLTEISSQIEAAVLLDEGGAVLAATFGDEERTRRLADGARRLLEEAEQVAGSPESRLVQIEAATPAGSVFVVRGDGRLVAATTAAEPTVGLVFYDLKSCLRSLEAAGEKPKRKPRRRTATKEPDAEA